MVWPQKIMRSSSLWPIFNTNLLLVLVVGLLTLIGILTLYSASLQIDSSFFQKDVGKQIIWTILGIAVAASMYFVQKKFLFDMAYILFGAGLVLLVLPYLGGDSVTGTHRWVNLGPIHFQPSEFMKIIVVVVLAKHLSQRDLDISNLRSTLPALALTLVPMLIILKQPDLGTSMIYFALLFPMLLWSGMRVFHIFLITAPFVSILTAFNFYSFFIWVVAIVLILYFSKTRLIHALIIAIANLSLGFATPVLWNRLKPYQQNRILTLFNVEADPQGAGYQVLQSQIAIGSGGFFGKGVGQGTQTHLKFLPEQHNDFIFSVIGEEYGFIGVMFVLTLFFLLTLLLIMIAYRQRERFNALIIIGIASVLFFHVVINVAMTIGLMPVTGLPLPFISYGGSFLITCYALIGIVVSLNIERT